MTSLPNEIEMKSLLEALRHLSWGAADILIAYARGDQPPYGFPRALNIENGGDGPVTAADLAVNDWLINGLNLNFPSVNWNVISEETAKNQASNLFASKSDFVWILDPLDGTKDFVQGSEDYAVHLALINKNEPVLGVVLIPEREELWFGIVGEDCWYENRSGIKTKVNFSKRTKINELILVASRNHRNLRLEKLLSHLEFSRKLEKGSVGCKVATILRGESDVYISVSDKTAPKDWDVAAPEALLNSAGGNFTHANGYNLAYNNGDFEQRGCLVASHGKSHAQLCELSIKALKAFDPDFLV